MKDKEVTVSIIMPAYNAEQTIERQLDAILAQSFADFELIVSDDGSVDQTWQIIQYYAAKDHRIIGIHNQHKGISAARNAALDIAKGIYVTFADADDWMDTEWLQTFMDYIGDYDCCEQGLNFIFEDGHCVKFGHRNLSVLTENEKKNYILDTDGYLFRFLCKLDLIHKYGIRFTDLTLAEDRIFIVEYLLKIRSLISIEDCHYDYYYVDATSKYIGKAFQSIPLLLELFYNSYGDDFMLRKDDVMLVRGALMKDVLMGTKSNCLLVNTFKRLNVYYNDSSQFRRISDKLFLKAIDGSVIAIALFKIYHQFWRWGHRNV